MNQDTPPPVEVPKRRPGVWRRRWLKRGLLVLGSFLPLFTLTVLWGWRYGFTRLPEPVAEVRLPEVRTVDWDLLPSSCAWEPIRRLASRQSGVPWLVMLPAPQDYWLESWRGSGGLKAPLLGELEEWLEAHANLGQPFDAFLKAPRPPLPTSVPIEAEVELRSLRLVPLTRAMLACPNPDKPNGKKDALRHLIDGFEFHARLTPQTKFASVFDERGSQEMHATLGRAFRDLVISGSALEPATGRALLEELRQVTNSVMPFEEVYALRVTEARGRQDTARRQASRAVRPMLGIYGSLLWRDVCDLPGLLWLRWGGATEEVPKFPGREHFLGIIRVLAGWGQQALAREADRQRMWHSRWSQLLADPLNASLAERPVRRDAWFNWFDRPAVWESTTELPVPATVLKELGEFLAIVESCRLTLALRLFRDREGEWPDSLEQLVPDVLPGVPTDPLSGGTFVYRRQGTGWTLVAGAGSGHSLSCSSAL